MLCTGGRTSTCASPFQPSIGTFLLVWKRGGRLQRRSGVLRRLPSSCLALIRIRRMAYRVCRRRDLVAVRAGRAAPWSRLMVFTRASALTWLCRALDVGPKLGRRSSSSVLQASSSVSSVSSCFSVGGSTSRSACVAAVSFVMHVIGNFSGPSVSSCKCDATSVTPRGLTPHARTPSAKLPE